MKAERDYLGRGTRIWIGDGELHRHGVTPEQIELGILPKGIIPEIIKAVHAATPETVTQEMDRRKLQNYLRRFPWLRLAMRKP